MVTKSIYKNVVIKDAGLSRSFVAALENAKKKTSKEVILSKACQELDKSQIRSIFGDNQ